VLSINYLPIIALIVGVAQFAVAIAWFTAERPNIFGRYAAWFLGLLGLANVIEAGYLFLPNETLLWSKIFAVAIPILPISFLAMVWALIRPDVAAKPWARMSVAFVSVGLLALSAADVITGAGFYYSPTLPATTTVTTMRAFIEQGVVTPVVLAIVLSVIILPFVGLAIALWRRWNIAERSTQWTFFLTYIVVLVVRFAVEGFIFRNSTDIISNSVFSLGLLIILLSRRKALSERLKMIGRDLPIGTKLTRGFGAVIVVMLVIALLSVFAIAQLNTQVQAVLLNQNQIAQTATALQNSFSAARRAERDYALLARTQGLTAAESGPYQQWNSSMADIAWLLDDTGLQSQPLSPAQRERVRTIITRYSLYYDEVDQYFSSYLQRGDNSQGAVNSWIQQAQAVDALLQSDPIASREFDTSLVNLRNLQFYYLTTQEESIANQIRQEYDALQEQILFDEIETPLTLRVNLQQAIEEESLGFTAVRESTRNIEVREESLEGAAINLETQIQSLSDQVTTEFNNGIINLDRQRIFYVFVIISTSLVAFLVAILLSVVITRQITQPIGALATAATLMGQGELGVRSPIYAQDEIGVAAQAFNTMAGSLDDLLRSLEERVHQRTAQLETAAQVAAQAAGSMTELQTLLDLTTQLIIERFPNIYHAQVFLIDQQGQGDIAVLRSSTGEPGQALLARQHRLTVASQSVIGRTTASGEYVLARTDDPETVHRPNELLPETKAELALPMRRGDLILGALDVQSKTADAFGPDDIQVLQILADQLTVAVENARLFRDANISLRETSRLFTASARIATAQSRDEVLDIFSDVAGETPQFDRLGILFFTELDAQGNPLTAQSIRTWSQEEGVVYSRVSFNVSSMSGELKRMAQEGSIEISDLDTYEAASAELKSVLKARGTQSALVIPLLAAGNYLGMVMLQRRQVGDFPSEVKRIFQLMSQQASIALNRFVLLDELTANVEDLQKIRESFLDISSATNLERLYVLMAPRAATLMRSSAAAIYAYDENSDVMRLVAQTGIDNRYVGEELRRGEGAAGQLIERRDPFTIQNYATYRFQPANHFGERFGPTIAAPLVWQEQLLGAIVAANPHDHAPFTPDDRDRLVLFTDQAALAMQNTRLLESSNRTLKEQRQLYHSTQALLGAGREEDLIGAVSSNLSEGNTEVVAIVKGINLPQPALVVVGVNDAQWEANTFPKAQYRYASDLFTVGNHVPARIFVPEGAQIWEMTPTRIALSQVEHELGQMWEQLHGFHHMMIVPIFVREGFWGAIIEMRREMQAYTPEDEIRATTIATQFAVALDNIRLLAESQRAAEQLTTAAEVSRVASSQLDVEEVLNRAVNLIRERFGHYHVQVFLLDDEGEWAQLRASTGPVGVELLARHHQLAVGSQSVIGKVTELGQYIMARSADVDATGTSVHRFNELLPETKTELALPMVIGERVVGALDVQSIFDDAFGDGADIDILQTLADQLAVAVENARLYQESQASAEDNKALYTASRAINDSRNSDEMARAIASYVVQEPGAVVSLVKLTLDANQLIREAEVIGDSRLKTPSRRLRSFNSLTLPILQKLDLANEVVVREDLANSEKLSPEERRVVRLLKMGAMISVPLRLPQSWTGLIMVSYPEAREISRREISRLSNITTQTSTTLQNRELLETTEQSLEESRLLFEASAAINTANSPRALLEAMYPLASEMNPAQIVMMLFEEPMFEGARPIRLRVTEGVTIRQETFPVGSSIFVRDLPLFRNLPVNSSLTLEDANAATHLSDRERNELRTLQLRSMLYLPLQVGNRYLGYIGFNMTEPARLRDNLVQRLQTVVQQAAIALQTQQYYGQAQRRAWREEQISRITSALNNASDPDEVLRIGLQELKDTLNVKRASGWVEPAPAPRAPASPTNGKGHHGNGSNGHHDS
jgi:GAF domain-containing protein/HAMP domain-containing protein